MNRFSWIACKCRLTVIESVESPLVAIWVVIESVTHGNLKWLSRQLIYSSWLNRQNDSITMCWELLNLWLYVLLYYVEIYVAFASQTHTMHCKILRYFVSIINAHGYHDLKKDIIILLKVLIKLKTQIIHKRWCMNMEKCMLIYFQCMKALLSS